MGCTFHWKKSPRRVEVYCADWHHVSYDMYHSVCIVGNRVGCAHHTTVCELVPHFVQPFSRKRLCLKALDGSLLELHEDSDPCVTLSTVNWGGNPFYL